MLKRKRENSFLYNIVKVLYPKEGSKLSVFYKDLLSKSATSMTVENLIDIKLVLVFVFLIAYLAVVSTNIYYEGEEVLSSVSDSSNYSLFNTEEKNIKSMTMDELEIYNREKAEKEALKAKEYEVYYKVEEIFSEMLDEYSKEDIKFMVTNYIYSNKLTVVDGEEAEATADRMCTKLYEMKDLKQIDVFNIIFFMCLAYFVPEAVLYVRRFLIKQFIYGEYLQLEVNCIMVGKLEPIKVEEILEVLSKNSRYFKPYIDEIMLNYFDVKEGYSDAFEMVLPKVESKELRYLLKALQQASEGDLKLTIENLENQRISNKEFRSIQEQNRLKKKDLLGILAVMIALVVVSLYSFTPFSNVLMQGIDLGI